MTLQLFVVPQNSQKLKSCFSFLGERCAPFYNFEIEALSLHAT